MSLPDLLTSGVCPCCSDRVFVSSPFNLLTSRGCSCSGPVMLSPDLLASGVCPCWGGTVMSSLFDPLTSAVCRCCLDGVFISSLFDLLTSAVCPCCLDGVFISSLFDFLTSVVCSVGWNRTPFP